MRKNNSNKNKNYKSNDKKYYNYNTKPKTTKRKITSRYEAVNLGDIRLNKFISDSGYCSRREADNYIAKGKVRVNGKIVGIGSKIDKNCSVSVNNNPILAQNNDVYIALNKPVGITCTTEHKVEGNIIDFINYPERIFPIGRLDKDSEGLILLTNDGDIVNEILRAGNRHEKEYIVRVNRKINDDFIESMSNGIPILGTKTLKCKVKRIDDYSFNITLIQGLNRQIRRMCEYLGYEVVALKRIRIMDINLGKLRIGSFRYLTESEIRDIKKLK